MPGLALHWDMLVGRGSGPLSFRLLIQPLVAAAFAVREGVKDARRGQSPYGWLLLTHAERRSALAREGWRHVRNVFFAALAIDVIYQLIVFEWIYPLQALVMATALAVLPYIAVRGIANRLARPWLR